MTTRSARYPLRSDASSPSRLTAVRFALRRWTLAMIATVALLPSTVAAQDEPRRGGGETSAAVRATLRRQEARIREQLESDEPGPPVPLEIYQGRIIAQTMHYTGAEWLIRDTREREERCSLMLANLPIRPGMTVCDMGCGNGFYTVPMARMAGANGQVLAVDVQPEMLVMLRERCETEGLTNITPILGSMFDPRLPAASVDLILLVDVYHEFSHPQHMLAAMRRSLKPDGTIVLVEYRGEDPEVPIKPLHKMTKEQVEREMIANGFRKVASFDELPWQHMLTYGIDPNWKAPEDYPDLPVGDDAGGER